MSTTNNAGPKDPEVGDILYDRLKNRYYKLVDQAGPDLQIQWDSGDIEYVPKDVIIRDIQSRQDIYATNKEWLASKISR